MSGQRASSSDAVWDASRQMSEIQPVAMGVSVAARLP